jgi:hypothetical protein
VETLRLPGESLVVHGRMPQTTGARELMAAGLLAGLNPDHGSKKSFFEQGYRIEHDDLGRPILLLRGQNYGPSLSFSYGPGRLYGAMAENGPIGLDFASPGDFTGRYPFHRVFSPGEFQLLDHLGLEKSSLAALLWSVKEAAVKSRGSGFHLIDPLEVIILDFRLINHGFYFKVTAGSTGSALARPDGRDWLALAWLPDLP